MKVKLLKDWAGKKKGEITTIEDEAVIFSGIKLGVFEEAKETDQFKPTKPLKKGKDEADN